MTRWKQVVGLMVAVAGSGAAGVAVGGQVREVEPPKVTVANKVSNAVPVSAVVTRMPPVQLEPGTRVELSTETIADLKDNLIVKVARPEWEYRELRVPTSPGNYSSVVSQLGQAGTQGWETTGVTFSDAGATVLILKRQK